MTSREFVEELTKHDENYSESALFALVEHDLKERNDTFFQFFGHPENRDEWLGYFNRIIDSELTVAEVPDDLAQKWIENYKIVSEYKQIGPIWTHYLSCKI